MAFGYVGFGSSTNGTSSSAGTLSAGGTISTTATEQEECTETNGVRSGTGTFGITAIV